MPTYRARIDRCCRPSVYTWYALSAVSGERPPSIPGTLSAGNGSRLYRADDTHRSLCSVRRRGVDVAPHCTGRRLTTIEPASLTQDRPAPRHLLTPEHRTGAHYEGHFHGGNARQRCKFLEHGETGFHFGELAISVLPNTHWHS